MHIRDNGNVSPKTQCICAYPGYCPLYQCHKSEKLWQQCQISKSTIGCGWCTDENGQDYPSKSVTSMFSSLTTSPISSNTSRNRSECSKCHGQSRNVRKPQISGPGTKLIKAYESKGLPSCQACKDLAGRMDRWGPDGCESRLEEIIEDILPRARAWMKGNYPWVHAILPGVVEDFGLKTKIRADVKAAIEESRKERRPTPAPMAGSPFAYKRGSVPRFISLAQFSQDVKTLASLIPSDTSRIVGVARSGVSAASLIAMLLHLPLSIVRQSRNDLIDGGNGWRLTGNTGGKGPVLVIDDTVMTGNSFKHVMPIVRKQFPDARSAAIYVNPAAKQKPDFWVHDLPWPHLLEWNMFNSVMTPHLAVDLDGILCQDCRPEEDDDGPRYLEFLKNAKPLYPIRKVAVPMIVTARLERYRPETLDWLARHGITVKELIMAPWPTLTERRQQDIAAYKAKHFKKFMARPQAIKPPMFVESEPVLAERIAKLSGGLVVCPAAGRCYA